MSVFDAIADPVRRAILLRLAQGPTRVVDLTTGLSPDHPISRPAISRHLRVLAEAGLVAAEDHGRERHYRLDVTPLHSVARFVDQLTGTDNGRRAPIPESALDALETEVRRTTRQRGAISGRTTASANTSSHLAPTDTPPTQEESA